MDGLKIINYKNKTIIYIDYTVKPGGGPDTIGSSKEKTIQLLRSATDEYKKCPEGSVLALCKFEGVRFDMDVLKVFKEEGAKTKPYEKKVAVIGIKGLLKAGYNFVVGLTSNTFKAFDSEDEAKEWLVAN
jgi:hypothetical protein